MRLAVSKPRFAAAAVLLVAIAATSGCSWFRRENKLYAQDAQSRPLEVPPDLDLPRTDAAMAVPGASVTASGTQAQASAAPVAVPAPAEPAAAGSNGFTVTGNRDETYAKVGEALANIEGLTIASRAEQLGAYDVSFEGSNFLVRVSQTESGTYVSAVDPRGVPATGEAPVKAIAALKAALAGN